MKKFLLIIMLLSLLLSACGNAGNATNAKFYSVQLKDGKSVTCNSITWTYFFPLFLVCTNEGLSSYHAGWNVQNVNYR